MRQKDFAYSFWAFLKKKLLPSVTIRENFTNFKIIIRSVTGNRKCGKKLLENVTGITKCNNYYKVKRFRRHDLCLIRNLSNFKKQISEVLLMPKNK